MERPVLGGGMAGFGGGLGWPIYETLGFLTRGFAIFEEIHIMLSLLFQFLRQGCSGTGD